MGDEYREKAEKLASRLYAITIERDELANGETVYFVKNPELPGCKAEGMTIDEAKANLADARVDYIHAFLEEGMPIPPPAQIVPVIGLTENVSMPNSLMVALYASDKTAGKTVRKEF